MRKAIGALVVAVIGLAGGVVIDAEEVEAPARWETFHLDELRDQHSAASQPWLPFLKVPALSTGLYVLPAGGRDRQSPHERDEVYYVIKGRSEMTIDDEEYTVAPGDVIFVAAQAEHRFHDIEEDLQLLVFFSEADPEAAEEE